MSTSGLDGFALAATDALFLDFDGTLAEIGPDPDAIRLPRATSDHFVRLAARLGGAIAVISGRDLRDLVRRTPAGIWRFGGHGLETLAPDADPPPAPHAAPASVLALLEAAAAAHPGTWIERKGPVTALHFRAAPAAEADCLAAAQAAARAAPDHVVQTGKMVVEVKPAAANKGAALRRAMTAPPFAGRRPVVLGDDATDEDAMRAALELGGVGVKVGPGPSVAALRAPDPAAVRAWLARMAGP
jgi:trehalose 6-phosphate phosphatase